jgi:DNA-binding response OmpR family regulator
MVTDALGLLLRDRGHEVFTAPDANVAAPLIDSVRPDFVVLDIELPGVTGDIFARTLRARRPATAVVLTSGRVAPPPGAVGPFGADLFLPKPFTPGALIEALQKAHQLRRDAA